MEIPIRAELRSHCRSFKPSGKLVFPNLQPPALMSNEGVGVFRGCWMRNLWSLCIAHAGVDMMGAFRAELEDIGLGIDEPLANDAPVREIASKFEQW